LPLLLPFNTFAALHEASVEGHVEIVDLLLRDERVDPAVKNSGGRTALHMATSRGHSEIVKLLLADQRTDPRVKGSDGRTGTDHSVALSILNTNFT
jgi:ankyrin repeat protein